MTRSIGTYSIKSMTNADFSGAIEDARRPFLRTSRPVVVNASISYTDKATDVRTFTTVSEFLAEAANDTPYTEAHLALEGSRNSGFGIHFEKDRTRLILKSSLGIQQFPDHERVFKSAIGLKPLDVSATEGEGEKSSSTGSEKIWKTVLLAGISAGIGFVLSPAFFHACVDKVSIHITTPHTRKGRTHGYSASPLSRIIPSSGRTTLTAIRDMPSFPEYARYVWSGTRCRVSRGPSSNIAPAKLQQVRRRHRSDNVSSKSRFLSTGCSHVASTGSPPMWLGR